MKTITIIYRKLTSVLFPAIILWCGSGAANAGFLGFFDGTKLDLVQVSDDGYIIIDNSGPGNVFRVTDSAGTVSFVAANNVVVDLIANTGNQLDFDLDNAHIGDATLNLRAGARTVNFTGSNNAIGNNLKIYGGAGDQIVDLSKTVGINVLNNLVINLGQGRDTVDDDSNSISVSGDMNLTMVNEFENNGGPLTVGGNVRFDSTGETQITRFDDDSAMTINGNFTYLGGDGRDEVLINDIGISKIKGNVLIDLGDNTGAGTQYAWFNSNETSIDGSLTVRSSNSSTDDDFQDIAGATFGGRVIVDLGGGDNDADFLGNYNGAHGSYIGGAGVDILKVGATSANMNFKAYLKKDDDTFNLYGSTTLKSLFVDFGCFGNDTFVDPFAGGPYGFPVTVWNLDPNECLTEDFCVPIKALNGKVALICL